jgi:hypothetical protein
VVVATLTVGAAAIVGRRERRREEGEVAEAEEASSGIGRGEHVPPAPTAQEERAAALGLPVDRLDFRHWLVGMRLMVRYRAPLEGIDGIDGKEALVLAALVDPDETLEALQADPRAMPLITRRRMGVVPAGGDVLVVELADGSVWLVHDADRGPVSERRHPD